MNNICLFTVIYPGCESFLNRFFESIKNQTHQAFDLLILNDGIENAENFIPFDTNRFELVPANGTIAEVREQGIKCLVDTTYEKIVFADADDFFSNSRIEKVNRALDNTDICVNDISIVTSDEKVRQENYFSNRLNNGFSITKEFILQQNILGLGNTSVRRDVLRSFRIPSSTIAVDWLIFTDMLLRGFTATFINNTITYYRQHESNTIGFGRISRERVQQALNVQLQNTFYFYDSSEIHRHHLTKLQELESYLSDDEKHVDTYLNKLKENFPEYPFWWEEIKTLEQLAI